VTQFKHRIALWMLTLTTLLAAGAAQATRTYSNETDFAEGTFLQVQAGDRVSLIPGAANGNWSVVYDSFLAGAVWGQVQWYASGAPENLQIQVSSSPDNLVFSTPVSVNSGSVLNIPAGRFLRVETQFSRDSEGKSPELFEITLALSNPPHICDVDGDGDVDRLDLTILFWTRNEPATGPDDPRDADGNGYINVADGRKCVARCTVVNCPVVAPNQKPVAVAGEDQTVTPPATVLLDGSGSTDPDNDTLTYQWRIVAQPAQSQASLSNDRAVDPSFIADQAGEYWLELIVNDSKQNSTADVVLISVIQLNQGPTITSAPVINGIEDQTYLYDVEATDPNMDPLTYSLSTFPDTMEIGATTGLISWDDTQAYSNGSDSLFTAVPGFDIADFNPVIKWQWANGEITHTPVVGPVADTNNDGFHNGLDIPSVVFVSGGKLWVISGTNGSPVWDSNSTGLGLRFAGDGAGLAIADLEGDGQPEVIAMTSTGKIAIIDHTGALKHLSTQAVPTSHNQLNVFDLDGDGKAEILAGGFVFDAEAVVLWGGSDAKWSNAVDLDMDGSMEVIGTAHVYRANGDIYWSLPPSAHTFIAAANVDDDLFPELVVVQRFTVSLYEHDGTLIWGPVQLPAAYNGGAPLVADFDNDGDLDIATAGTDKFRVFDARTGAVIWDAVGGDGGGGTSSSAFDFNGDGIKELLYNVNSLRVFDGGNGIVVAEEPNYSRTWVEYPIVVDVDNNHQANIVAVNNQGLTVWEAADQQIWQPARSVWNQYEYRHSNINDDLSVPTHEPFSWLEHNSHRVNVNTRKDLKVQGIDYVESEGALEISVLNRGLDDHPALASLNVYVGDPANGGQLVGNMPIPLIAAGESASVRFEGVDNTAMTDDVYALIDRGIYQPDDVPENDKLVVALVDLMVADPDGLTDTQKYFVSVAGTNEAPVISGLSEHSTATGRVISFTVKATDPDSGDVLHYSLEGAPAGLVINPGNGAVSGVVNTADTYNFTARVTDAEGLSVTQNQVLTVFPSDLTPLEITSIAAKSASLKDGFAYGLETNYPANEVTYTVLSSPDEVNLTANQLFWNTTEENAVQLNRGLSSCVNYDDFVFGAYGSSSLFVKSNINKERFPDLYQPLPPTLTDTSDIDVQISLGVNARVLAGKDWGFAQTFSYTTFPPVWTGMFTRLVVAGSEGANLGFAHGSDRYSRFSGDGESTLEERALGFHNDTLVSRLEHDVCETENNFGQISGLALFGWDRCMVPDWGSYGVLEGVPNPTSWLSDIAIVHAEVVGGQTINLTLRNRGLRDAGQFLVKAYEKRAGSYVLFQETEVNGLGRIGTQEISMTELAQFTGDLRLVLEYPNSENLECLPDNNTVDLFKFSVEAKHVSGLVATQDFWVAGLDDRLTLNNHLPGHMMAGSEYVYRADISGGQGRYHYTLSSAPAGASIDEDGEIRWQSAVGDAGERQLEFVVTDDAGSNLTVSKTIQIQPAVTNESPVVLSIPATDAVVGREYRYQLAFVDPEEEEVTILSPTSSSIPGAVSIDENQLITWTPTLEQYSFAQAHTNGLVTLIVELMDAQGAVTVHSWTVNLRNTSIGNHSPQINSTPLTSAGYGELYSYQILATDPDNNALNYLLETAPAGMTLVGNLIEWTPAADQVNQNHPVSLVVSDGLGGVVSQRFAIEVTSDNHVPEMSFTPVSYAVVGQNYSLQMLATDEDGDSLTYGATVAPAGMTVLASGLISWTPTTEQTGEQEVTLYADDGQGRVTMSYRITVTDGTGNVPPDISSQPATAAVVGQAYSYNIVATDAESDPLFYALDTAPAGMTLTGHVIRWTPASGQLGDQSVSLRVTDGNGTAIQGFTITVSEDSGGGNFAPDFVSEPRPDAYQDQAYTYKIYAVDRNGFSINTIEMVEGPAGMTFQTLANGANITWTPTADQVGAQYLTLKVTDQELTKEETYPLLVYPARKLNRRMCVKCSQETNVCTPVSGQ